MAGKAPGKARSGPGGRYGQRALRIFAFGAIGAGLTALGFGIGGEAWGWLVLAALAVRMAAGGRPAGPGGAA
jgi:hypothetical protein